VELQLTVVRHVIVGNDRKGNVMATVTQLGLIQDTENRSRASRQFADAQLQNIAGQDEEAVLVLAAKSGDGQAFEVLIERHRKRILAVVLRFTRNRDDAEDIMQQSLPKAFVHLHKFERKSSFSTWLTRLAINEALTLLRRGRVLREVSIDDLSGNEEAPLGLEMSDSRAGPESVFLQDERSRILSAAMNKMTPGIRTAIEFRGLRELSTRETARLMGLSVPAVKGRLFQGRRKLHQVLKRESACVFEKRVLRASRKANGLSHHQLVCSSCD
jgi:RNA polymerase sigma-70 factor (ECF subfamily)